MDYTYPYYSLSLGSRNLGIFDIEFFTCTVDDRNLHRNPFSSVAVLGHSLAMYSTLTVASIGLTPWIIFLRNSF